MTTRACRLMGVAFGNSNDPVEITVLFNGQTVFSGPVPTRDDDEIDTLWDEHDILCEWAFAQDVDTMPDGCSHGIPLDLIDTVVPVSVSVNKGIVHHQGVVMNHRGNQTRLEFVDSPQWATYTPESIDEFQTDVHTLGFHGFEAKYGMPWARASEMIREIIIAGPAETFLGFGPKKHANWALDGEAIVTTPRPGGPRGPAHRKIPSGSVLTYELNLTSPTNLNYDGV